MQHRIEAYLDIETTGFSSATCIMTVVGIYRTNGETSDCISLIGGNITTDTILESLNGADVIYTYNGSRFDLPFIHSCLDINLETLFKHHDLMYDCWKNNLYGGLKSVEKQLGIERILTEVNGYEAVRLWWKYINESDEEALATLIEYNKEDVVNLKILRDRLL